MSDFITCTPGPFRRGSRFAVGALCALLGGGCADAAAERQTLAVFAASSLTETFGDFEREFEASHPGVDVRVTFAGSQVLRLQIEQGAAAGVFASADADHLRALAAAGHVEAFAAFAQNDLVLITPPDNPAGIDGFAELARAQRLVIGTTSVPIGAYTRTLLDRAQGQFGAAFLREVRAHVVSEEANVRLLRAKVVMGEADAAIVYRTDAMASPDVRSVEIPDSVNVQARYFVGRVMRDDQAVMARAFVDYVHSAAAAAALRRRGFEPVP